MPDTTTAPAEAPAPVAKRSRSFINQSHAAEIILAGEIANTAELPAYATLLADEGIDAAFITGLRAKIAEANALVASASGKTTAKQTTTRAEEARKSELIEWIATIQARAKRKYPTKGDPLRANYFIGQRIDDNRTLLETSTRAIIAHLATDTLPGMKAGDIPALQAALDAYHAVQTTQAVDQSGASSARGGYEAKAKEVAALRRQIQYAVDALWPAKKKANAPIRVAFKLSPDRALG